MINPLISIIVPCYNQAQYLGEALQSVLSQTNSNWECIIINDGSTDDTEIIAKQWCTIDKRFNYYHKKNCGISSARNFGINKAKGAYIQFLDSDDILVDRKLELSLKELNGVENSDKSMVISNFRMCADNVNKSTIPYCNLNSHLLNYKSVLYKWDLEFSIPIHCGLFHTSLFEEFKFPEEIKAYEDWIMWLHFFQLATKVFFIDKPLVFYRVHSNNVTKNLKHLNENYIKTILLLSTFLKKEDVIEYYKFLLEDNNMKINDLTTSLKNYHQSKIFRIYKKSKKNQFLNYILKLFSISK